MLKEKVRSLTRLKRRTSSEEKRLEVNQLVLQIPKEVWHNVFTQKDVKDLPVLLLRLSAVCTAWRSICGELLLANYPSHITLNDGLLLFLNEFKPFTILNLSTGNYRVTNRAVSKLTNLTSLTVAMDGRCNLTEETILELTNLTELNMSGYTKISTTALNCLTNLTSINISRTKVSSLVNLTKLRALNISVQSRIIDNDLYSHTNITSLNISCRKFVTDDSLSLLTNLTELDISGIEGFAVTDESISLLTNLTSLSAAKQFALTDRAIQQLTNLKVLDLRRNNIINKGLLNLTNLTHLSLCHNTGVKASVLTTLQNLRMLNVYDSWHIKDNAISKLTNITILDADRTGINSGISLLQQLRELKVSHSPGVISVLTTLTNLNTLVLMSNDEDEMVDPDSATIASLTNLTRLYFFGRLEFEHVHLSSLSNLTCLHMSQARSARAEHFSLLTNLTAISYIFGPPEGVFNIKKLTLPKLRNVIDVKDPIWHSGEWRKKLYPPYFTSIYGVYMSHDSALY